VAPSTEDVAEAKSGIVTAIEEVDWSRRLQDSVETAMRRRAAPGGATSTGRLGLWIEAPWLVVVGGSAVPTLTVHGEMLVNDACAIDRRWRWNGDTDDFVDLGEDGAAEFRKQMAAGVDALGKAIIADLFLAVQARQVAYKDQSSYARGAPPLMVLLPDDYQNRIGSWDTARDLKCAGLLSLETPAPKPQANSTERR
jgi:hypothetical protein